MLNLMKYVEGHKVNLFAHNKYMRQCKLLFHKYLFKFPQFSNNIVKFGAFMLLWANVRVDTKFFAQQKYSHHTETHTIQSKWNNMLGEYSDLNGIANQRLENSF